MWADYGLIALRVGGALHFVQLPATLALVAFARRVRCEAGVPAPLLRILGVLGGGIILAVASGGILALLLEPPLLATPFGVTFAACWTVFWAYRLGAQLLVYRSYVPRSGRWVHWTLTSVFLLKTAAFASATSFALAHCPRP